MSRGEQARLERLPRARHGRPRRDLGGRQMKRALALGLAAALGTLGAALAAEKGGPMFLRVEEEGGAQTQGKAHLKKEGLEVETPGGTKKISYKRVASIEEVDPEAPPPDAERPVDRADFEARAKAIEEKQAKDKDEKRDGSAWSRLGVWAKKKGLDPQANKAFAKALELLPDDWDARHAMGMAKADDESWQDVNKIWAQKKFAAGKTPAVGVLYDLGKWAAKNGLDDEAIDVASSSRRRTPTTRPCSLTSVRSRTGESRGRILLFPLRGRWRGSSDPSHHHEKKVFAVYAVDYDTGEVDGKPWKGDGKNLEDHYAWGQPIYACADGQVVDVREGFPDNPVGQAEGKWEKHNGCYIMHTNGEASWYLHTQKGSITVKKNDYVKRGTIIAKVGNSGGSTQPHLHFTLVDAFHAISIPWRCDDDVLIVEDGTKIKVKRGRPVEGQLIENDAPSPETPPK